MKKAESKECAYCHIVRSSVRRWHAFWCPLIDFIKVLD